MDQGISELGCKGLIVHTTGEMGGKEFQGKGTYMQESTKQIWERRLSVAQALV